MAVLGEVWRDDDTHLMVARLHRVALVRLSDAAGRPFNGLAVAAKHLRLSSNWKRKTRELDAMLGMIEKLSTWSMQAWLFKLDDELMRVGAPATSNSDKEESDVEGEVAPESGTATEEEEVAAEKIEEETVKDFVTKEDASKTEEPIKDTVSVLESTQAEEKKEPEMQKSPKTARNLHSGNEQKRLPKLRFPLWAAREIAKRSH